MKHIFNVCLLLTFSNAVTAQILTIQDEQSLQPLEQAIILSQNPLASATTDKKGQADISEFQNAGQIQIEHIGYRKLVVSYTELEALNFRLLLKPVLFKMDEVIVSATRWQQEKSTTPQKVATVNRIEVELNNPQTAADLLNTTGQVFVQKSQLGGGSPMIRGFSTNRLLISVDGVRMNSAIFRSGNIQNVIALDPFAIDRTEVLFGPGSVMYGSDAIGAVMSFYTLMPEFAGDKKTYFRGNTTFRTSSANFEKTAHTDIAIGKKHWAFLTSLTFSDYDNQTMGSNGPDDYLRRQYVKTINGIDSIVNNPNNEEQVPTGYRQFNLMQKIRFQPNASWDIHLGIHYSTTSDNPRYDRLLLYRGENLRSAEWYYGPQVWALNNLNIRHSGSNFWFDHLNTTLAWQYFEESRHDRDFRSPERTHRKENVNAYSFNLDFEKSISDKSMLYYGSEYVLNLVNSTGSEENLETNTRVPGPSRYPDGAKWQSYAVYLNAQFNLNQSWTLHTGLRYNHIQLDAAFDSTFYKFPFSSVNLNPGALIGSMGFVYNPFADLQTHLNLSTGFRAPNVDDIGKVFDSEPGSVVVPNPDLKSEYAYNAELGFTKIFDDYVKLDLAGYYTLLNNAMVRRDFMLNGADSIFYDGELSRIQSIQNAARASVYGIETGIEIKLPHDFNIISRFNYQRGEEELDDGRNAPLRHAGPWFGDTHIQYNTKQFTGDLFLIYNGTISNRDLAPEEQNKAYLYAKNPDGNPYAPGWYTLNLKLIYRWDKGISVTGGVENITDQRYRPYASGLSAPGRNFIAAIKINF